MITVIPHTGRAKVGLLDLWTKRQIVNTEYTIAVANDLMNDRQWQLHYDTNTKLVCSENEETREKKEER